MIYRIVKTLTFGFNELFIFTSMKRLTAIFILGFYSISVLGIGIRQFYCCGNLKTVSISFNLEANEKCNKGDKKGGCCKTEIQVLKVKDSHFGSKDVSISTKLLEVASDENFSHQLLVFHSTPRNISNSVHSPPIIDSPIYILNCVYRI